MRKTKTRTGIFLTLECTRREARGKELYYGINDPIILTLSFYKKKYEEKNAIPC